MISKTQVIHWYLKSQFAYLQFYMYQNYFKLALWKQAHVFVMTYWELPFTVGPWTFILSVSTKVKQNCKYADWQMSKCYISQDSCIRQVRYIMHSANWQEYKKTIFGYISSKMCLWHISISGVNEQISVKFGINASLWTLMTGKLLWSCYLGNGCHVYQIAFSEL